MEEKNYLTLVKEDGTEVKAEILFTCHSEEFAKDFVVFMPEDADGGIAAASFSEESENEGSLEPITEEAEWKFIEEVLDQYMSSLEENSCCGECCEGSECCEGCDCECDCDENCRKNCCN